MSALWGNRVHTRSNIGQNRPPVSSPRQDTEPVHSSSGWDARTTISPAALSPTALWSTTLSPINPHGHYNKLVTRFYEALVLSHALGKARGQRTKASSDGSLASRRKQFLNDLSYVCDSEKGGETTTAIAIESEPTERRYVFWFALNKPDTDVGSFLGSVLNKIRTALTAGFSRESEGWLAMVGSFTEHCSSHAQLRIEKEICFLRAQIKKCIQELHRETSQAAVRLKGWLERFRQTDDQNLICSLAYEQIHGPEMTELGERGRQDHFTSGQLCGRDKNPFYAAHHLLGRLASHIRVPRRLLENADCLQEVLDSGYIIRQAEGPEAVATPKISKRTDISCMLGKMGFQNSVEQDEYTVALGQLDMKYKIQERVETEFKKYRIENPTVHAEIKLLDLFHREQKMFFNDFRFIGCSKPACYCCKLYIQHHPARCIEPDSHQNVWLNWSPPAGPAGSWMTAEHYLCRVLQKVTEIVREGALEQIIKLHAPLPRQFDSTTGITRLDAGALDSMHALRRPPEQDSWSHKAPGNDGMDRSDTEDISRAGSGGNAAELSSPPSSPGSSSSPTAPLPASDHDSTDSKTSPDDGGDASPTESGGDVAKVSSSPTDSGYSSSPAAPQPAPDLGSADFESDPDDGGGILLFKGRRAIHR